MDRVYRWISDGIYVDIWGHRGDVGEIGDICGYVVYGIWDTSGYVDIGVYR